MKKVGIIGGLAPQSTELFYKELINLCQERERVEYPNILINSLNLNEVIDSLEKDSKDDFINYTKREVGKIQDYVDFIVIVCNTAHFVIDELRKFSKVPIMAIHEETCKKAKELNCKKVGILGTKTAIDNKLYQDELDKLGIRWSILSDEEENILNRTIYDKMVWGKGYEEIHKTLLKGASTFKGIGCDGVILGCSELPLFISQKEVDIKLLPSTNILAESVYNKIFE